MPIWPPPLPERHRTLSPSLPAPPGLGRLLTVCKHKISIRTIGRPAASPAPRPCGWTHPDRCGHRGTASINQEPASAAAVQASSNAGSGGSDTRTDAIGVRSPAARAPFLGEASVRHGRDRATGPTGRNRTNRGPRESHPSQQIGKPSRRVPAAVVRSYGNREWHVGTTAWDYHTENRTGTTREATRRPP